MNTAFRFKVRAFFGLKSMPDNNPTTQSKPAEEQFLIPSFWYAYVSGAAILFISMVAIYSLMNLIVYQTDQFNAISREGDRMFAVESSYNDFIKQISDRVYTSEKKEKSAILFENFLEKFEELKNDSLQPRSIEPSEIQKKQIAAIDLAIVSLTKKIMAHEDIYNHALTHEIHEGIDALWFYLHSKDRNTKILKRINILEDRVYWSVVFLGMCAFIMLLLHAEKMRRLHGASHEKKQALNTLQNRLAAIEASPDGIWISDPGGHIEYMNLSLKKNLGLVSYEDAQKTIHEWIQTGASEIQIHHAEKGFLDIELSTTSTLEGGMVGIVRDVTDRRKNLEEKQALQEQFYQAQKMEAVGRLAGGIAHDFNNILAAINGYAEFLIEDLENTPPPRTFAENILKAGREARNLVDQILAFSRRKGADSRPMDIAAPVRDSIGMLQASVPKSIEMRHDFGNNPLIINGNATQIAQAVMNLCVNAIDAMEGRQGTLTISLDTANTSSLPLPEFIFRDTLPTAGETSGIRYEEPESTHTRAFLGTLLRGGDYARLQVRDTGGGISRTIMERIFEPFFTTKEVGKGTGLGLATVHGVVSGHRGAMIVDSFMGRGTSFELFFPLEQLAVEDSAAQSGVGKEQNRASGHIILVEDQKSVLDMTEAALTRMGYKVTAFSSALGALNKIREIPYNIDLVLTDQNMPKMTGFELAAQVARDYPAIPFIIFSGYSIETLQDIAAENPSIKTILRKPLSHTDLGRAVTAAIQKTDLTEKPRRT